MPTKPAYFNDFDPNVAKLEPDSVYLVIGRLTTPMLGTAPLDKDIYASYIASRRPDGPDQGEIDSLDERQGQSGFHRMPDGTPYMYDYMVKGFLKAAAAAVRKMPDTFASSVAAFKRVINTQIMVESVDGGNQRGIILWEPENGADLTNEAMYQRDAVSGKLVCVRSLRAQTPQGERTALAKSEVVPAGTQFAFRLVVLSDQEAPEVFIRELLAYASEQGFGQWRSAGNGRAEFQITRIGGKGTGRARGKRGKGGAAAEDEE